MPQQGPQPVERQLPTDEARFLLDLTRDLARREIAPAADSEEEAGRFPRETMALIGAPDCSACPTPRSTAAAASRTKSTCRCWRSWRPRA